MTNGLTALASDKPLGTVNPADLHTHTDRYTQTPNRKLLYFCLPACVCVFARVKNKSEGNCWAVQSLPCLEYSALRSILQSVCGGDYGVREQTKRGRRRNGSRGGVNIKKRECCDLKRGK